MIFTLNSVFFLNKFNQLIFVTVKWSVFFAVRTEILNTVQTSFGLQRDNQKYTAELHLFHIAKLFLKKTYLLEILIAGTFN
jgi:hypothetical protein